MNDWRASAALSRAWLISVLGVVLGLIAAQPVLVVVAAPFAVHVALMLLHRPRRLPAVASAVDNLMLHEDEGTTWRLSLSHRGEVEQLTRLSARVPFVQIGGGRFAVSALADAPVDEHADDHGNDNDRPIPQPSLDLRVRPRRWGIRSTPTQQVVAWSAWAGFAASVVLPASHRLRVIPGSARFATRAEVPRPVGLVGAHRSARRGSGTDIATIRAFTAGDRLRRIHWPASLRHGELQVVDTRAEQDAGVLLVLDALAEHGISEGWGGRESSLDLAVRASTAVAEVLVNRGDRVGVQVLNERAARQPIQGGRAHLVRLRETLMSVQPGRPRDWNDNTARALRWPTPDGTFVIVLSPLFETSVVTAVVSVLRRGQGVLVIDTLPVDHGRESRLDAEALAGRLRMLERSTVLAQLARIGCPVVPWRGPGTLDPVLHQLARRRQTQRGSR